MNEFNNNETKENLMDIPVALAAEEIQPSEPPKVESEIPMEQPKTIADPITAETSTTDITISNEETVSMNNLNTEGNQNLSADSQVVKGENYNNEPVIESNQINPTQITMGPESDMIPETMDLNYGVIPPNNSETIIKQNSSKKSPKIIGKVVAIIIAIGLLVVGFFTYKFYFAIDPIKTITTKIREFGINVDEIYQNAPEMLLLKNNDKLSYQGEFIANIGVAGEQFSANLGYDMTMLKSDNKANANVFANLDGESLLDLDATIFKSALFVKVLEGGHNFRVNTDATALFANLDKEIENIANTKTFETYTDYFADAIENNVSKKDFEISTEKTDVNGKSILANKYSLTLTEEMVNGILVDFVEALKADENIGAELQTVDTNTLKTDFENMKLNIYISLKGVIKVELIPQVEDATGKITYSKVSDEHKVLIVNDATTDLLVMDIYDKKDKTTIDATLNIEETILSANFEVTESGNINGNISMDGITVSLESQLNNTEESKKIATDMTLKLTVSMPEELEDNIVVDIKANSSIVADDSLTVAMPSGSINIETAEGEALFEEELSQTGLYTLIEQLFYSFSSSDSDYEEGYEYYGDYEDYSYSDEI